MLDRFDDRTLEITTVIVVVLIALVILCYLAIYINPQFVFNPFKPPTPTPLAVVTEVFGPTWTPTATPTTTSTPTSTPTWTPTATPTNTSTPLPPTATNTPTPTPTSTRAPTKPPPPPRPTATPTPWPYVYESAGGRGDCGRTWVHGYVLGANGLPESGVQMRAGNRDGTRWDVWTDENGYYEAIYAWEPQAGQRFVRVFKGGQARSMQFWWETSSGCDGPYSLQEVEITWRHR
jgi:hypothetical protein